ncbi:RNA polymerase sigma factor (plasmid) [Neorhizobium galegae bv. officinalis bv. officinalis str. HAMBI 1141]|uniref:RNA polymerase sigma factor n=1 Tax=Neorhizobium galegae bv. officinalis bv. officinalis str. HAMBI 1141 TaxID=1028801 RepID=A0A068THR9_NEOGA|nr:sigma-70 family RNA polymerase sigma factor [Neorhizobium galegae]CDN57977.1 RNA polymerase sigma factor [Neorhizobium galegae bv. officinalis bv. officinalis str. HAMBI 1141]
MLAIAAGRQHALAQLVERHGEGLTAFARRYLGSSREDAEDVVQEVFWTVWRKAAHFDPDRAQVTTWLYRIAANRCIDIGRRNALLRFVGLDAMPADPSLDEPDAEVRVSGRSELSLARKGILDLPRRQRMALLLRAVADLDVAEIAQVMGTTGGSVEQLLVRARRALREHMAKAGSGVRLRQ